MTPDDKPLLASRPRLERSFETLNMWRAVRLVAAVAVTVMLVAALVERLVEPHVFTSYWLALWWSVVTVATVGYGDIVPHSDAGRAVAMTTIVFSMALIPTVTSLIVAALIGKLQRQLGSAQAAQLEQISKQLDEIERRLAERR